MTIKLPKPGVFDHLLRAMGKKRGVSIAGRQTGSSGPAPFSRAAKESFWKALIRPAAAELPDGMTDLFFLLDPDREGPR